MQIFLYLMIAICLTQSNILAAQGDEVKVFLVSEKSMTQPGDHLTLGVKLRMKDGWHTYWKNPGDAGYATRISWNLPPKTVASEIFWPAPKKLYFGDLVNYGYSEEVILLSKIHIPNNFNLPFLEINALVEWLACKDICIPGKQKVSTTIPIGEKTVLNMDESKEINNFKDLVPGRLTTNSHDNQIWLSPDFLNIRLHTSMAPNLKTLTFFPANGNIIEYSDHQNLVWEKNFWTLKIKRKKENHEKIESVDGVLVANPSFFDGHQSKSISITNVKVKEKVTSIGSNYAPSVISLSGALFFSLLGGLFLNFMPCVFPVVSIKVLNFLKNTNYDGKAVRKEGMLFSLGILTTFWIIFAIMTFLVSDGSELGWGYQLQSPVIISGLALLFAALALNLLDVFVFGSSIQGIAGSVRIKLKFLETFLSGVLATVVATPCTAPFMGAALGFSITQPHLIGFIVFSGIGIGMASPYLVLSFQPRWVKLLPKPGKWMQTLKQALSFPLFFTVAWLVWVLGNQNGVDSVLKILFGILLLSISLFIYGKGQVTTHQSRKKILYGLTLFFISLSILISWPDQKNIPSTILSTESHWKVWKPEIIESTNERPIFVDFTAAWCLTCQFNKKTVLENKQIVDLFVNNNFLLLRADWTNHNPEITRTLKSLGRRGIPLYVIYPTNRRSPVILPEILTKKILMSFIEENSS